MAVTDLREGRAGTSPRVDLPAQASSFVGRECELNFSIETFAVAPGEGPAPVVHDSPIPDAPNNPQFALIHTYHLGLFFDSPGAARRGGCPDTVTPFNGRHRAGIKALSTRNFPDSRGPLRQVLP